MSIFKPDEIDTLEAFQNADDCQDWKSHDPTFEWTEEELAEFARDEEYAKQEQLAMAAWWEMEGVRCATFGRDPNQNPYQS